MTNNTNTTTTTLIRVVYHHHVRCSDHKLSSYNTCIMEIRYTMTVRAQTQFNIEIQYLILWLWWHRENRRASLGHGGCPIILEVCFLPSVPSNTHPCAAKWNTIETFFGATHLTEISINTKNFIEFLFSPFSGANNKHDWARDIRRKKHYFKFIYR